MTSILLLVSLLGLTACAKTLPELRALEPRRVAAFAVDHGALALCTLDRLDGRRSWNYWGQAPTIQRFVDRTPQGLIEITGLRPVGSTPEFIVGFQVAGAVTRVELRSPSPDGDDREVWGFIERCAQTAGRS